MLGHQLHDGNFVDDSTACTLMGLGTTKRVGKTILDKLFNQDTKKWDDEVIFDSRDAMKEILKLISNSDEEIIINIEDDFENSTLWYIYNSGSR